MTETRRPSVDQKRDQRLSSVVLPAPLHPASPITFILFSEPDGTGLSTECFISAYSQCHASLRMMTKIDKAPVPLIVPNPGDRG